MASSKGRGGKELVRRKEALARAASRMASERREAEEVEAARRRREVELDELVADFELAREDEAGVVEAVEEEVRLVRARGQARIDEARRVAARVVVAIGERETVAGTARRLGVGVDRVKELRRLGREDSSPAESGPGAKAESGPGAKAESGGGPVVGAGASRGERGEPAAAGGGRGVAAGGPVRASGSSAPGVAAGGAAAGGVRGGGPGVVG